MMSIPANLPAQRQREVLSPDENAYDSKFFDQLRSIFGRFRDADLRRAFQTAEAIQCSELIQNRGEWKTVAFFNEDRSLGEWCYESIEQVKTDLSIYRFKGACRSEQATIQLTTEFPVGASIEAYNAGKIDLDKIDVNVNAPVNASFDIATQAYRFDLPYLFLKERRNAGNVYSLMAPHVDDSYATDVVNRWECKAVKSDDVTYRFLICRTETATRNKMMQRNQNREPAFGSSAYFILSDGMEAHTSVNISFGDTTRSSGKPQVPAAPAPLDEPAPATGSGKPKLVGRWQTPDAGTKIVDAVKGEFKFRFASQTWSGKLASPQNLVDQKIVRPSTTNMPPGKDYCEWRPEAAEAAKRLLNNELDLEITYSMSAYDKNSFAPASIVFNMNTNAGVRLGTLQCVFPGVDSAAQVPFDRWVAIVGGHIALESRK